MSRELPVRELLIEVPTGLDASDGPVTGRVVAVHPGALAVSEYQRLARDLPSSVELLVADLERVPAYFAAALSGRVEISVPEIAAAVLDRLRARGPLTQPWTLLGWSFGGVVAHELLAQLAPGEQPARLVVLDSIAPVEGFTKADADIDTALVLPWFADYLSAKRGHRILDGHRIELDAAEIEGLTVPQALDLVLNRGTASGALLPGTSPAGIRKVFSAYAEGLRRNNTLGRQHRPRRTDVPVVLLRPERGLLDTPEPLGWDAVASDLSVADLPGDHYTALRHPDGARLVAHAADPLGDRELVR